MRIPHMPGTYEVTHSVPDNEILLVFNSDDNAAEFREWLEENGWRLFLTRQDRS